MKATKTKIIDPFIVSGQLRASASKSAMQRVVALALLNTEITVILNPGTSNDDLAALEISRQLGAEIKVEKNCIRIKGPKEFNGGNLNAGESGLSLRMFTPIAALSSNKINFTGSGSLLQRPMGLFEDIFPLLKVHFETKDGYLPFSIRGPLMPENIEIDGSLSSQFLTGFLLAFSKKTHKEVIIKVNNLSSKPYIELTLKMMQIFGYDVKNENDDYFFIKPKIEKDKILEITVEGDWSGAAFHLVGGAISGKVMISGLDQTSVQGDRKIIEALRSAGAGINITEENILVTKNKLVGFNFDSTDCPDLFPPLVALAACCKGETIIKGTDRLTHKESNRAETLKEQFGILGVQIENRSNHMYIQGADNIPGGNVNSCNDHRIAMALAIMAGVSEESIILEGAEAVNKSYPDFFKHLEIIGAKVIDQ